MLIPSTRVMIWGALKVDICMHGSCGSGGYLIFGGVLFPGGMVTCVSCMMHLGRRWTHQKKWRRWWNHRDLAWTNRDDTANSGRGDEPHTRPGANRLDPADDRHSSHFNADCLSNI